MALGGKGHTNSLTHFRAVHTSFTALEDEGKGEDKSSRARGEDSVVESCMTMQNGERLLLLADRMKPTASQLSSPVLVAG